MAADEREAETDAESVTVTDGVALVVAHSVSVGEPLAVGDAESELAEEAVGERDDCRLPDAEPVTPDAVRALLGVSDGDGESDTVVLTVAVSLGVKEYDAVDETVPVAEPVSAGVGDADAQTLTVGVALTERVTVAADETDADVLSVGDAEGE